MPVMSRSGTPSPFSSRPGSDRPAFHHAIDVSVDVDSEGLVLDQLGTAMAGGTDPHREPAAVILQPRAHNPTGASMSADRAARKIVQAVLAAAKSGGGGTKVAVQQ